MTNFYEDESKLVVMQEEELKEGALLAVKGIPVTRVSMGGG